MGQRQSGVLPKKLRQVLQGLVAQVQSAEALEVRVWRGAAVQVPGVLQVLLTEGQPENAHDGRAQDNPGHPRLRRRHVAAVERSRWRTTAAQRLVDYDYEGSSTVNRKTWFPGDEHYRRAVID